MPGSGGVVRQGSLGRALRRTRTLVVLLITSLTILPTAFGRSVPPVRLVYRRGTGAEGCPSAGEMEKRVRALLGRDPFRKNATRTLQCTLTTRGKGFHGHLELREHGRRLGVREIDADGPSCQALADAAALSMALAIDPLATPPRPPTPPAVTEALTVPAPVAPLAAPVAPPVALPAPAIPAPSTASRPLPVSPTLPLIVPLAPSASPRERPAPADPQHDASRDGGAQIASALDAGPPVLAPLLALDVATRMALVPDAGSAAPASLVAADGGQPAESLAEPDAGVTPKAVPEAEAATAPSRPRILVGAGAGWVHGLVPKNSVFGRAAAGVRWSHVSLSFEGTYVPPASVPFQGGEVSASTWMLGVVPCLHTGPWGGCALLELAAVNGTGTGFDISSSHTTWMPRVGLRAQWEWVFAAPLGLRLNVDPAFNVLRPRLIVDNRTVWEAPAFSFAAGGSLFLSF